MDLTDRIVVVTGGGSGIGRATIERLRDAGARPVAWDLRGGDVDCDVSDAASVAAAIEQTVAEFGAPTGLVAAAGVASHGRITELPVEEWDRTFAVNVRGVFLCVQAVAQRIIASGEEGAMVLVASVNGVLSDPLISAYSSSKAAVAHLARCAAFELGEYGIRVNAIGPGPTDTPMLQPNFSIDGFVDKVAEATPLRRMGSADDVAEAIVGTLELGWVTGQFILADGGLSLASARGSWKAERKGKPPKHTVAVPVSG